METNRAIHIIGVIIIVALCVRWDDVFQMSDSFQKRGEARSTAETAKSDALKEQCYTLPIARNECIRASHLPLILLSMFAIAGIVTGATTVLGIVKSYC